MSRECITFDVGEQVFGLDIGVICDIRPWSPITRVPGLPPCVVGVVTRRGAILPVIDLAARLGWAPTIITDRHRVLFVEFDQRSCALVVEAVGEMVLIDQAATLPPPALGDDSTLRLIEGFAPLRDRMVQVLDIAALAGDEMMAALASA